MNEQNLDDWARRMMDTSTCGHLDVTHSQLVTAITPLIVEDPSSAALVIANYAYKFHSMFGDLK